MDSVHYNEMIENLHKVEEEHDLNQTNIFVFGHCSATEKLIDWLLDNDCIPVAIIDNNENKQGLYYREIKVISPTIFMAITEKDSIVLVVARAFESMKAQLIRMGYEGKVYKLIDYNSFDYFSLSQDAIAMMVARVKRGKTLLDDLRHKYEDSFFFFCPFAALGDIYIMMGFLPIFCEIRNISSIVIVVVGNACKQVVELFGDYQVEAFSQRDLDEIMQAALYHRCKDFYIAHQDRPYVVDLHKVLYQKKVSFEKIYCCGVFGLPETTVPKLPCRFAKYTELEKIPKRRAVILSPYAKSVSSIQESIWKEIVDFYTKNGFTCFTNVVGNEQPLDNTLPISPRINEIKSVVERAGTFIGIRSGLCDVIREAKARKIALYPDYYYCDTKWKAIDIYYLEGWENIVVDGDFRWKE